MCILQLLYELSTFFVAIIFLLLPRIRGQNATTAQVLEVVPKLYRIPPALLNDRTQEDGSVVHCDFVLLSHQQQLLK